jgi:hypothetical protein
LKPPSGESSIASGIHWSCSIRQRHFVEATSTRMLASS